MAGFHQMIVLAQKVPLDHHHAQVVLWMDDTHVTTVEGLVAGLQ